MSRPMRRVFVVAATSAAVTLVVAFVPEVHFAFRQPRLHVALESSAALIALLAAFLLYGRLRRSHRLDEFLLATALAVLALSNLTFAAIPASAGIDPTTSVAWAAALGRGLGAVILVAAAVVPARRIARENFELARAGVGTALFFGVVVALTAVLRGWLPEAVDERSPSNLSDPELVGHPALLGALLVVGGLYAAAAVGFARRAERRQDDFLGWLAVGCVLAAFSLVNYFLFPSLYSDWVYVGDLFRLLFYVVLLVAALREITRYWEAISAAAALEERRLIAQDLHDGLAQELAYVRRALPLLDDPAVAAGARDRMQAAVARAQDESRRLIRVLTSAPDEPVDVLVAHAARDAAERWGIELELDLAQDLRAVGARREAIMRIAAEAVTNVGKHSGADAARVALERAGERLRLRISDDGHGFDPTAPAGDRHSFGLVSMRERAVAVGGTLGVTSEPEEGTTIEAIL